MIKKKFKDSPDNDINQEHEIFASMTGCSLLSDWDGYNNYLVLYDERNTMKIGKPKTKTQGEVYQ